MGSLHVTNSSGLYLYLIILYLIYFLQYYVCTVHNRRLIFTAVHSDLQPGLGVGRTLRTLDAISAGHRRRTHPPIAPTQPSLPHYLINVVHLGIIWYQLLLDDNHFSTSSAIYVPLNVLDSDYNTTTTARIYYPQVFIFQSQSAYYDRCFVPSYKIYYLYTYSNAAPPSPAPYWM